MYYLIQSEMYSFIYKVSENEIRCIPIDDMNMDYIEYKKWLDVGNSPLPWTIDEGGV